MTTGAPSRTAGELFDERYELLDLLGGGTSGEVWRALDHRRGHVVALKILEGVDEDAAWHEATRLTELSKSPHILSVNNASLAIDVPYIDTELAPLGTAAKAASPMGLAPGDAVRLTRALLRGLELCHQRRLLHRDVKPANLFLAATGDAQLGDFGLAAFMDENDSAKVAGDPDVRAPEVLKGARCTPVSDIYSAGMTLYALIAGGLPFSIAAAGDFAAHKAAVLAGAPDIRDRAPHVGIPLAKVVRKATAVEPGARYLNAAAFDAALAALPEATYHLRRVPPHTGHSSCWSALRIRDQHAVAVCVESKAGGGAIVTAAHVTSGSRIKGLCGDCVNDKALLVHLRRVFGELVHA
jgi:serine/threonine protein kinase